MSAGREARMKTVWSVSVRLVPFLLTLHAVANAQSISLKTIPLASGDQFAIFPSQNFGMAGVSIALDDSLLDPFVNPAKGARVTRPFVTITPTTYTVSSLGGTVQTLPAGGVARFGNWFVGAVGAIQSVDRSVNELLRFHPLTNSYRFVSAGRVLSDRVAVGGSVQRSIIRAIDGSERFFGDPYSMNQYGHTGGFRLGTLLDLGSRRFLEAMLLHERVDMTYEVTYRQFVVTDSATWQMEPHYRNEHNQDVTRTWGVHVAYRQPIRSGWRIGGIFTSNYNAHPKIPTYELEKVVDAIPRDPGHSWAYDVGLGVTKTVGHKPRTSTLGIDLVFEPAWSHTWADADTVVMTASGGFIPVGGRTVENWFTFSNATARFGITQQADSVISFQIGLDVKIIDYGLEQRDHVAGSVRHQNERWTEWTPTWGLVVTIGRFDVRYQGAWLIGNEPWLNPNTPDRARSLSVLAAPIQGAQMTTPSVTTHRLSIAVAVF